MSTISAGTSSGTALVSSGDTTGNLVLQTNGTTTALTLGTDQITTSAATYNDVYGKVRAIPQSGSAKTTSYTLATTDVGQVIQVGSGGSITIPNSTFSTGDVVSIFNNTSGSITITCSTSTTYRGGTDISRATLTLLTRGVATVLFISATVCVVNGNLA